MFIAAAIVELMKESEWYTTLVQSPEKIRHHFFIKAEMRKNKKNMLHLRLHFVKLQQHGISM